MLEGVVTWVLKYYLGDYVEIDSIEQLSFGLLQGQVELENLPLKKDALKSFAIPLEVKSGFVGKIHLSVPIKQLRSRPWVITLEKLYLVAGPIENIEYDETQERENDLARKQAQLKVLEEKWKMQKDMAPQDKGAYSWWSYGTNFVANIAENIQLQVKDVHLRYEDDKTIPGCPFACGVVIDNLSAESTDGTWQPKFVSRHDADMMHKLVDLKDFSIYWDTKAEIVGDMTRAELEQVLRSKLTPPGTPKNASTPPREGSTGHTPAGTPPSSSPAPGSPTTPEPQTPDGSPTDSSPTRAKSPDGETLPMLEAPPKLPPLQHDFILEPVCARAMLKRNTSALPLRTPGNPRITMDISMETIAFDLSETQFRGLVAWVKEFDRYDRGRKHRQWRPSQGIMESAGDWWRFAIQSHLTAITQRNGKRTKAYVIQRCKDNVQYVHAYVNCLTKGDKYMDVKLKAHMEAMEKDWTFEELKILREIAMNQVLEDERAAEAAKETIRAEAAALKETGAGETGRSQGGGGLWQWIPGLSWYGYGGKTGTTPPGQSPEGPGPPSPSQEGAPLALEAPPTSDDVTGSKEDTDLDQEVIDMLADSAENNTLLKRDMVFAQLNFSLKQGVFRLMDEIEGANQTRELQTLLELECSSISMVFESRPRTRGMKFGVSVGGLYLRDKMTPDSLLSVLVAPQQRTDRSISAHGRSLISGVVGMRSKTSGYLQATSLRGTLSPQPEEPDSQALPLFEMSFEKRPQQSKADYRLEIKTRPLDMIYNPTSIRRVKEFFTIRTKKGVSIVKTELEIAAAAKSRYETLKQQTQAELRQTLDQLLEGDEKIKAKRWEFDLDVSAPQIIVPESFSDPNATLVVFDLGRLQFYNTQGSIQDRLQSQTSESDDDFVTPSSTPPNEPEPMETDQPPSVSDIFSEDLSEAVLREKIYDKYTLNLNDVQVMVGKARDNWKFAHNKGTSHMHVVDKLSISLQFDRRLLYTSDPQWPKATLSGTLPSLTLHINEQKVQALKSCAELISVSSTPEEVAPVKPTPAPTHNPAQDGIDKSMYYSMYQAASKSVISLPETMLADQQTRQAIAESRLILTHFSINHVSLEVQSRGRSIAELQVSGVNANFTKRPYDTSISFSIHSLLVVDAVQTLGQDFELLVASHKNLCLDTHSGSIRDSDPNSPISPCSPLSPSSPAEPARPTGPPKGLGSLGQTVTNALQSLVSSTPSYSADRSTSIFSDRSTTISPFSSLNISKSPPDKPGFLPIIPVVDTEALIKMEVDIISPNCPTQGNGDGTLHIANLQFNNLDFIANQQTIVELLSFFNGILPNEKNEKSHKRKDKAKTESDQAKLLNPKPGQHWEVNADFHRLNVLLMRVEEQESGEKVGKKVATATMTEAKVQATLSGELELEGSLGGLQLLDLTPEGSKHQKVFSVGLDVSSLDSPDTSRSSSEFPRADAFLQSHMFRTAHESLLIGGEMDRAFTFSYNKDTAGTTGQTPSCSPARGLAQSAIYSQDLEVPVTVRMASLCYTHAPRFLKEVSQCVEEFREYTAAVGDSIRHAAAEVAKKMVKQPTEYPLGGSLHGSTLSLDGPALKRRRGESLTDITDPDVMDISDTQAEEEEGPLTKVKLDFVLQTPVIMLPRTPDSPEVLVAHLGRISIKNTQVEAGNLTFNDAPCAQVADDAEQIHIEIRDMSMYSVNLDRQKTLHQEATRGFSNLTTSVFSTPQPGGYLKTSYGTPILHDTVIELIIQQNPPIDSSFINPDPLDLSGFTPCSPGPPPFSRQDSPPGGEEENTLYVTGKVVTPLKLVVNKKVYEQLLQTVDNITPDDDDDSRGSSHDLTEDPTLEDISEEVLLMDVGKDAEPSVSALKLDDIQHPRSSGKDKSNDATKDASKSDVKPLVIRGTFEMPSFSAKLCSDVARVANEDHAFINLQLLDFKVNFEKADQWTKCIELTLQSLVMEDLLQPEDAKHRRLMVSSVSRGGRDDADEMRQYLSSSCPTSMIDTPLPEMPPSLPTSLHNLKENVFSATSKPMNAPSSANRGTKRSKSRSTSEYPCTPPPSPQGASPTRSRHTSGNHGNQDYLVHISLKLVDKKCPEFASKYNRTNRFVDVDFNSLDTTINLQTWVVLLDFLGMGTKIHDLDQFTREAQSKRKFTKVMSVDPDGKEKESVNTEVDLKIQSFNLIFNKPEYELAKANISKFTSHVSLRDGNFTITGELGSMSLQDSSPHGKMFRERFITTGHRALNFEMFKYGTPDPDLIREYDMTLKLRMASVRYVHTHRFMQEILAFLQHFLQLQDILGRERAFTEGKIKMSNIDMGRGARILMDIQVDAPKLLIPHSSRTTDVLVFNMGTLNIRNAFLRADSPGTITHRRQSGNQPGADADAASNTTLTRGRSGTTDTDLSDNTYQSFLEGAGLLEEELANLSTPATSPAGDPDPMTSSIYGSLDQDFRSDAFESTTSSPPSQPRSQSIPSSSTSLGSFYSAVGGSTAGNSTSIGGTGEPERPKLSRANTEPPAFVRSPTDPHSPDHKCLLDAMHLELLDMDVYSAEWRRLEEYTFTQLDDLEFPSYVVQREHGEVLREKCRLTLQVERNLEGDISHASPDLSIDGKLSSLYFLLDVKQFKLVKGLLQHNFGEQLEQFQRPDVTAFSDPVSRDTTEENVFKVISITLDLDGVSTELLVSHSQPDTVQPGPGTDGAEVSLARFDFIKSRLTFESYSDGCKDIDLVSNQIRAIDTRYRDAPVNVRPNVFSEILKPSRHRSNPDALQMEIHWRTTRDFTRFTILLNNMRLMGVLDWLLSVKDFLLTGAKDPFKTDDESGDSTFEDTSSPKPASPVTVSGGIFTKRPEQPIQKAENPFELRLNVTDTELVVVEDTRDRDTNAVILKNTAVLCYRPQFDERPVSCSLQSLEVFSCYLAAEDESALSIIDPMSVTIELNGSPVLQQRKYGSSGLLEAASDQRKPPIMETSEFFTKNFDNDVFPFIEVQFNELNVRFSYHDVKLFLAILNSMPQQLVQATQQPAPKNAAQSKYPEETIAKLEELGFSRQDAEKALLHSKGRLDNAALWLTHNASPIPKTSGSSDKKDSFTISGFEIKAGNICFCVIDDCLDADVPLAEISLNGVHFLHKVHPHGQGNATFKLSGEYYNKALSGWEPFLEHWGCQIGWQQGLPGEENKLSLDIRATDTLNFNITKALIDEYNKTKAKWTADYYKAQNEVGNVARKRQPFTPFAINNQTGCVLQWRPVTTNHTRMSPSGSKSAADDAQVEWKSINPGEEQPFVMEQREKIRHKSTHELKTHQLVVKVNGWEAVTPVTMDKVGVYFRQAEPVKNEPSNIFCEVPPARIVFDVNIEGSARKVVTVRSALLLHNRLSDDIEVKLDSTLPDSSGRGSVVRVPAGSKSAMPLKFVHSKMLVRPVGWSLDWCKHPITWEQVARGGYSENSSTTCDTLGGEADTYRFCVSVYRQPYPVDPDRRPGSPADTPRYYRQPGHIISITPPLRLENLLPMELTYTMRIGSAPAIRNSIKPGQVAPLIMADMRQAIEMTVELENFPNCQDLCIPGASYVGEYTLYMSDMNHRQLHLRVKLRQGLGGSVKLSIFAYFWLINKSGVPIIFKQDGGGYNDVAAGQFAEHELARSVTPLLFAFTDKERPSIIAMRLGESVHGARNHTEFCTKFQLERGITYRALAVKPHEGGPSWVYNIGIEARQGRGRYRDTMLVTFAPRYTIDNRSSHKLGFAQKHTANRWQSSRPGEYASVMPKSTMTYHWVRVDLDNLLCVRLIDDQFCQWSGGFRIDRIQSQHINMRAEKNKCIFLRVDVVMQGSTFFAVFSDAEHMPPPYRVDNFAEVPIQYFQTRISDEKLRTHVKPRTSVPYAWDEPTLPPHITLRVPGGSSATYDMNVIADGEQLCYENFIYISFIGTFQGANGHPGNQRHWSGYDSYISEQRLVLDVVGPNKVILKKKETGKRSQLWRMTSTGMLQHEGSSVPRDPRKPHGSSVTFVLDISDLAHQPTRDVHLTLRKPDDRRKMTQTWRFTEDGRLCCGTGPNSNLCVQAKDGFFGLRDGGDAVLGPSPPNLRSRTDVPIEMAVYRQKMQPGSGFLSVKVLADGPTRVLQITDIRQQQYRDDDNDDWCLVSERRAKPIISASQDKSGEEQAKPHNSWEMSLHLPAGIGVSVVNDQSEELIYISLKDIIVDFQSTSAGQIFTASVKNVQIDNQIFGTIRPVLLYVTPKSRKDSDGDRKPALQISGHKVPSSKWNADIYKYLMVAMKRLTIQIEEVVLWKFLEFAGFNQQEEDVENLDENSFDTQRALAAATSNRFKRYYFGALKISTNRVTLSMYTASELPKHLKSVKQAMGIPLVKFEEAKVELDPYVELHPFETKAFLTESIKVHYTEELKSQAAKILGSVDFLGNPLGLFHDVAEGVSGLLEGNVSGLLKNVTHGVSDSAAKVTGSLSDGVSSVTLDRNHERQRRQIREHTGSSSDHLVAGFKGLTHGFVGGLTGIFSQTYSGARNEGIEGLFTGFAKGAVGVVTKPVAGVLDFASGAASAVRDTSKTSARIQPNRVRLPRCCYGQGEVLPPYSDQHAEAQEFLYHCNHHAYKEKYISSEKVMLSKHAVLALVTNRKVYFLPSKDKSNCDPLMECDYLSLVTARVVSLEGQSYIELTKKQNSSRSSSGPEPTSKPKIRCDSEVIAQKVCQQILYAKSLFEEQIQTLPLDLHHHGD